MITGTKIVWRIDQNEDLTEGRGASKTILVCLSETTANRLAQGKGVMGCPAYVEKVQALKINDVWYTPVLFKKPSGSDIEEDEKKAKSIEKAARKQAILSKAKLAGLSQEEIDILGE